MGRSKKSARLANERQEQTEVDIQYQRALDDQRTQQHKQGRYPTSEYFLCGRSASELGGEEVRHPARGQATEQRRQTQYERCIAEQFREQSQDVDVQRWVPERPLLAL